MVQGGEFVAFLPGDNQDLASADNHAVIKLINQDLSQLLLLPPQRFWQVVLTDKSLHTCLDSFLRFRRRCYDESTESIQGSSDLLLQLSQRVFRIFWRMAHPQNEQQQSSPAAAGPSHQQVEQLPSHAKVAEQLYNNGVIDVPKMLDIAVLYGPGNSELTGQLLQQLMQMQPRYAQDIVMLAEPLSGNLHALAENVKRLADQVLKGKGNSNQTEQLLNELAEAVRYYLDAFLTLQAFIECLPPAAALLLHPNNHGSVLLSLAVIYSSVVPALLRIVQQPEAAVVQGLDPGQIQQLQRCIVSLVYQLLRNAFCTAAGAAAAAAVGDLDLSSSSSRQGLRSPGGKGSTQQQQQQRGFSAELQGQGLMNLLMLLAHPSDHTYGGSSSSGSLDPIMKAGLLAAVNHRHQLDVAVAAAVDEGLLALDDAQFDYLLALVDGDRDLLQQRQQQQQQKATSSQTPAAAGDSSSSTGQLPQDLPEKIRSIKELLPDYGDGFLTAILYHCNWGTEQAINCLLEGSLPKAVQGLDPLLKTWVPPGTSSSSQRPSSLAAAAGGTSSSSGLSWTGLAREAAAAAVPPAAAQISLPSLEAAAAAAPKPQIDRRTGRILGALPNQVRSVTKNMAYELQYEYDDEYDDSFDDLIGPGNDGVCDIEGEDSTVDLAGPKLTQTAGAARPSPAAAAAGTADIYADEPSTSNRGPQQQQQRSPQQQQQQQRGRQQKDGKLWVLDGKVYNYKKEGAVEVTGQAGAQKAVQAATQAAQEIYGLGPGGNVPLPVDNSDQQQRRQGQQHGSSEAGRGGRGGGQGGVGAAAAATAAAAGPRAGRGEGSGPGPREGFRGGAVAGGRGRGDAAAAPTTADGASSGEGRGRGRGGFAHKEQHKAAVANHHRKDRAAAKNAKGML